MIVFEKRGTCKTDKRGIGQCQPHIARQLSCLGAMGFIRYHDDVITGTVRIFRIHFLIEFMDETEDIPVILFQYPFQFFAGGCTGGLVIGYTATDKCPKYLAVQIIAIRHYQKSVLG